VPVDGDDPVLPIKKYLIMGVELRGDSVIVGKEWSKRNGAFPRQNHHYGAAQSRASSIATTKPVIALPDEPSSAASLRRPIDYDLNTSLSRPNGQHIWA